MTTEGGEAEPARAPSLAVGPDGTAHLAWTVGGDPAFAMNGSLHGLLMRKLAVNEAGDVAVANSSFAPGEASRIVLVQGRVARATAGPDPSAAA